MSSFTSFVEKQCSVLFLRVDLRSLGVFGFKSGSLKASFSLLKIIYITQVYF